MDLVYICRPGENEELRYSLRSLINLPHDRVWIVGDQPKWVRNVQLVKGNHRRNPHQNVYHNVLVACREDRIPDQFVLMNDDFFITEPIKEVPVWYRSKLISHIESIQFRHDWWRRSLDATHRILGDNALSYELHVPFPVDKAKMRETLERWEGTQTANPPQWRTLYGNEWKIGGIQQPDCKAYVAGEIHRPFHSTYDLSFPHYVDALREMFPDPSPYEEAP